MSTSAKQLASSPFGKPCLSSLLLVLLAACGNPSHEQEMALQDGLAERGFAAATADGGADTPPPDTHIDSSPPPRTKEASATFTFSSTEAGSHFECMLPGKVDTFTACGTSVPPSFTASGLGEGLHTFKVRAVNASGKFDPAPAEYSWTVDMTAPTVTLNEWTTNGSTASFAFSSNETGSFECALDTLDFSPCGSANSDRGTKNYSDVPDGEHVFYVRAIDVAGNASQQKSYKWKVDTSPDTTLITHPEPVTRRSSARFEFSSSAQLQKFECKLDNAEYAPCDSPQLYPPLPDGDHLFAVRAVNAAGIVDASPAFYLWRVDTLAPDTLLDLKPPALTHQTSARFQFSSPEADVSFECSCDNSPFARCDNPSSCTGLTEGRHSFSARAMDGAGNMDLSAVTYEWRVDLTPPQVTLNSVSTSDTFASFSFSSPESATFECSLDGQTFSACPNPARYDNLDEGSHSFTVRAIDEAGNIGPARVPAFSWTVDLSLPDTRIELHPDEVSGRKTAAFNFASTKAGSTFRCSLDDAPFSPCSTLEPPTYSGLGDGVHTFSVFSVDPGSRQDPSPAFFTWKVDTVPPVIFLDEHPLDPDHSRTARFAFASSEPGSTFECSLESQDYEPCDWLHTLQNLADGPHRFMVRAVDKAGNRSDSALWPWKVDTTPPDIQLNSHPPPSTNQPNASFSFSSHASDVSYFECSLDGDESDWKYVPCTAASAFTVNSLPEGPHWFHVRVTDSAGNSTRSSSYTWRVDLTPPEVRLTASTTPDPSSPTFTFDTDSAEQEIVHFECSLDLSPFTSCEGSVTYHQLSDTSHTFAVHAIDSAGNVSAAKSYSWTVPSQALDTYITDASPGTVTSLTEASFLVSANKPVQSFKCSLDGASPYSCGNQIQLFGLANGTHTLLVYAIDLGGRLDSTPASYTWEVDTVAPQTAFSLCPAALTHQTTLQFTFAPSEPGAHFECSLDGADFTPCPPPSAALADGFHTLEGRAVDKAGNIDRTPAVCEFTVDTQAPDTSLLSKPSSVIGSPFATFTFTSEPGVSFQCSLDGADFTPCTNPARYYDLQDGPHSFSVRAVDAAGNADASQAEATFSVAPAPLAPVVEHPAGDAVLATRTPTFQGSAQPGITVSVFADDTLLGTTRVDETGRWSLVPAAPLQEGLHTMSATATNASARTSLTSPPRSFALDNTPPETTIDSGPPSERTAKEEATFTFSSTEPRSTFACSLDDAAFAPCESPLTLQGLGVGTHQLRVAARDVAGNMDKSPAEYAWTRRVMLTGHGEGLSCGSSGTGGGSGAALFGVLSMLALLLRRDRRSGSAGNARSP